MTDSILVVDDDNLVLESLGSTLRKAGYKVRTAKNGNKAIEMIDKKEFDVVLTDLVMEDIDGIKVLEKVKTIYPETIVIVITGYGSLDTAIEALQRGAFDYLLKPFSDEKLKFGIERGLEKKRLKKERDEKNRELENFVYTVTHDLKTPLLSLIGYSDYLLENYQNKLDKQGRHLLDRIRSRSIYMNDLIDDLSEFSQIGRVEGKFEKLDIFKIINKIKEELNERIVEKKVVFKIVQPLPSVFGNKVRVHQVFCNLIDNALKFNDKQVPVIEAGYLKSEEKYEDLHTFYVRDNGEGIDKENWSKIFNIFQRINTKREGSGIGLSIVKKIIEQYNGRIWVESEKGKGSTFYFTLPGKKMDK